METTNIVSWYVVTLYEKQVYQHTCITRIDVYNESDVRLFTSTNKRHFIMKQCANHRCFPNKELARQFVIEAGLESIKRLEDNLRAIKRIIEEA